MLLAVDVGNTQTNFGVFKGDNLCCSWRISTNKEETADELAVTLVNLLSLRSLSLRDIDAVVISSVVPHCTASLDEMVKNVLNLKAIIVGPGIKTEMPLLYDNPREVGADRIVNAVAAYDIYGGPVIVVDFGTATTFDAISSKGEYIGGTIAPGIEISSEALFEAAAKLSRVDLKIPRKIIGKNTVESLQAGIMFGFAGQVDRIVNLMKKEMKDNPTVVSTGGLANLITSECETIDEVNSNLTLLGLKKVYEMNR